MLGCVVASLLIHLADTDDPYYLNRSVWVAEHGTAALRDTMFSPEVYNSPYGGGVPIASIEALYGVLAHLTGLAAGTMTYVVGTAVGTALAVWALWRLARAWAPRRAFWVFLAAVAFLMLSGDSMLGNFWIPRMWQGKVLAVTILMPLVWAYLSDLVDAGSPRERRRALGLLLAAGVTFFGLTPTAVVWAPVTFGAVLVAAVLARRALLAVGGAAMLVGPLVSGAAVVLFSTEVGGTTPTVIPSRASFVRILGEVGPMVALALVALCLAPVLARRGAPAAMAGASALVAVGVFAPGVLPLLNAVTGSGPILWRMLFVAPIAVLVGLLAALPWAPPRAEDRGRAAPLVAAAGVAGVAVLVLGLVRGRTPGLVPHRPRRSGHGDRAADLEGRPRGPGRRLGPEGSAGRRGGPAAPAADEGADDVHHRGVPGRAARLVHPQHPRAGQGPRRPSRAGPARLRHPAAAGTGPGGQGHAAARRTPGLHRVVAPAGPGDGQLRAGRLRRSGAGRLDGLPACGGLSRSVGPPRVLAVA